MSTKVKTQQSEEVKQQSPSQEVANAIDGIKEYGGFSFIENIVDGYSN